MRPLQASFVLRGEHGNEFELVWERFVHLSKLCTAGVTKMPELVLANKWDLERAVTDIMQRRSLSGQALLANVNEVLRDAKSLARKPRPPPLLDSNRERLGTVSWRSRLALAGIAAKRRAPSRRSLPSFTGAHTVASVALTQVRICSGVCVSA